MASGWNSLTDLGKFGLITQGFGAVSGVVGSYYSAKSEHNKTKSLALNYEHQKDMTLFNQRMKWQEM